MVTGNFALLAGLAPAEVEAGRIFSACRIIARAVITNPA